VARTLTVHVSVSKTAQLGMDQWGELFEGSPVAFTPRHEQFGDLVRRHREHLRFEKAAAGVRIQIAEKACGDSSKSLKAAHLIHTGL
jgi:hypothetical protein